MSSNAGQIDYAIIGGGISGLASAWFLQQRGYSVQVLEAASEIGGTLRSRVESGFLIEQGPNSTLENTDALGELISGVGLNDSLQVANPVSNRRYILKNQRLESLPLGVKDFLRTPLFSARGKLRLLAEPFIRRATTEESIAEFVRRRLGEEFLDWAIDPFISGVYAGDPERLSIRAATAKIYALEVESGSLIRGMVRRLFQGKKTGPTPSGRMISFAGGMQTLARGISLTLGASVRTQSRVTALEFSADGRWRIRIAPTATLGADMVIARAILICIPADQAAQLLAPLSPIAATILQSIRYPAVASVALGFRREQIKHPLDGFGFLIPRRCNIETLGTLFSSSLFPNRAPDGCVLLTSFLGGARNSHLAEYDDDELSQKILQDISPTLGITGMPTLRAVTVWPRAIPQYELGHLTQLANLDNALNKFPQLFTRANWRDGISVADCVRNARDFARLAQLN